MRLNAAISKRKQRHEINLPEQMACLAPVITLAY
jgi:hypothetical protein